ncbi:MAG: hypothetical protein KHY52_04305 [Firmicutes bacterium]|nr:hypothetical protein [Bacillota bacterium]
MKKAPFFILQHYTAVLQFSSFVLSYYNRLWRKWQPLSAACRTQFTDRERMLREALIQSARADGARFFGKSRYGKRRNTLCTRKGHAASVRRQSRQRLRNLSSFSYRWIDEKDPASAADD